MSTKTQRDATYALLIYINRGATALAAYGGEPYAIVPIDQENNRVITAEQYFKGRNGVGGWESWWTTDLIERSVATYGDSEAEFVIRGMTDD